MAVSLTLMGMFVYSLGNKLKYILPPSLMVTSWSIFWKPVFSMSFNNMFFTVDTVSWSFTFLSLWIFMLMLNLPTDSYMSSLIILLFFCVVMTINLKSLISMFVYYELSIIPITMIILSRGHEPELGEATFYMISYTLISSVPFLAVFLTGIDNSIPLMFYLAFQNSMDSAELSLMLFMFFVKTPVFLFHHWLPKAHVESPAEGSMILAGLLLKYGIYGLLRGSCHVPQELAQIMQLPMIIACLIVSNYSMFNPDSKLTVALSSVTHMMLAAFLALEMSMHSMTGSLVVGFGHGGVSIHLFFLLGTMFSHSGSRSCFLNSGMSSNSILLCVFWFLALSSNANLPPSLNFVGEMFVMITLVDSLGIWSVIFFSVMMMTSFVQSLFLISVGFMRDEKSVSTLSGMTAGDIMMSSSLTSVSICGMAGSIMFI